MAERYEWSQTKAELTISLPLPEGVGARDISCNISDRNVSIRTRADVELLQGKLWSTSSSTVWSVDGRTLNLEVEKVDSRFWPCALEGGTCVDVKALEAKEKRDAEPVYKPHPGEIFPASALCHAHTRNRPRTVAGGMSDCLICLVHADAGMVPQQVTDKATIRKLKAEFPQLELPVADTHTATHANYAGHRSAFSWGSVDRAAAAAEIVSTGTSADAPALVPAVDGGSSLTPALESFSPTASTAPSEPQADAMGAPSPPADPQNVPYSWGSLPTLSSSAPSTTLPAALLPSGGNTGSEATPAETVVPPNGTPAAGAMGGTAAAKYVWGALPP